MTPSRSPSPGGSPTENSQPKSTLGSKTARRVLEDVLRETDNPSTSIAELQPYLAVVQDFRSDQFDCGPISEALIRVALKLALPRLLLQTSAGNELVREVSQSLCSDPLSRQRLERFWTRLVEQAGAS